MAAKVINISLSDDLLREIDRYAREEHRTRSELFREAARQYMESRRWRRLRELGSKTAGELGLSEDDIERIVQDYRSEAA